MQKESLPLALVAVDAVPRRPDPVAARVHRRVPASASAGPGWFDSSWELRCGLEVKEGWSDDDRVRGWIEGFLAAQRSDARTASPSSSTAIA